MPRRQANSALTSNVGVCKALYRPIVAEYWLGENSESNVVGELSRFQTAHIVRLPAWYRDAEITKPSFEHWHKNQQHRLHQTASSLYIFHRIVRRPRSLKLRSPDILRRSNDYSQGLKTSGLSVMALRSCFPTVSEATPGHGYLTKWGQETTPVRHQDEESRSRPHDSRARAPFFQNDSSSRTSDEPWVPRSPCSSPDRGFCDCTSEHYDDFLLN